MAIKLRFFAQSADWIGFKELDMPFEHPQKLGSYLSGSPLFKIIYDNRSSFQVAVNYEMADFNKEINDHDEIAFLPPYSGG